MKSEVSVRKLVEKGGANGAGLRPCSRCALRNRRWKALEWAAESGSLGTYMVGDTGTLLPAGHPPRTGTLRHRRGAGSLREAVSAAFP